MINAETMPLCGSPEPGGNQICQYPPYDESHPSLSTGDPNGNDADQEVGNHLANTDLETEGPDPTPIFNDPTIMDESEANRDHIEAASAAAPVAVAEWPTPSPLTVHQQADPYPLDTLPETIQAAVQEVVSFVQCPVALAACSALSGISLVGQGLIDVRRANGLEGPTSLYILAIADSGERKSTVDGYFSKPVRQWEEEQEIAARTLIKEYQATIDSWEVKRKGVLTAIQVASKSDKDTSALDKKLTSLEKEKPKPPKVPKVLFVDATSEELAFRLAHEWPVSGVLSSEAGLVFGSHSMGSDTAMRNMALLNSLWGAEPTTFDRRTSESYTLRNVRLTMGLAAQPGTVRAFLNSSKGLARDIGWLARFLIAWPESTQGTRLYKDPPELWPSLDSFHKRLRTLLDLRLPLNDYGALSPRMLEFSPEAKLVWVDFHDEVETELRPGREMAEARDIASKAADNAARVAALFHLFEYGSEGTISLEHMESATRIAAWHLYEARRFVGEIAISTELHHASKLDTWLIGYCKSHMIDEVSVRTIQQMGPSCTRDKQAMDSALKELVEAGRVRRVQDGKRNQVIVNPALLGDGHGAA